MSIEGVQFKDITSFKDQRGFFRELIRVTDPFFSGDSFGQWSHSRMYEHTVKAWHFHHLQVDWWYVPAGVVQVVLFDYREESPTFQKKLEFLLGDPMLAAEVRCSVVRIPQGVLHGCKVLSPVADLFYITSRTYDPNDEGRFPFDSDIVPHDWGEGIVVAENDRRLFIPTAPRIPIEPVPRSARGC